MAFVPVSEREDRVGEEHNTTNIGWFALTVIILLFRKFVTK